MLQYYIAYCAGLRFQQMSKGIIPFSLGEIEWVFL